MQFKSFHLLSHHAIWVIITCICLTFDLVNLVYINTKPNFFFRCGSNSYHNSIFKEIQLQAWESFKCLFYSWYFVSSVHLRTSRLKAHYQKMFNMILNFEYFILAKILTFHYLSSRCFVVFEKKSRNKKRSYLYIT